MKPSTLLMVTLLTMGAVANAQQKAPPKPEYLVVGEYVNPQDTLPRIRYFDGGQVSLNDRCAVRKGKLNTKMPPIYVNGQPIGFC